MFEQTQHSTMAQAEVVQAYAICTNRACGVERPIVCERHTVSQMGQPGTVFARMAVVETHHLTPVFETEHGALEADDGAYVCTECGGACVVSAQPRREIPHLI